MKKILQALPQGITDGIKSIPIINEISLRSSRKTVIKSENSYIHLNSITSSQDIAEVLQKLCNYSVYAYIDELKQGFITVSGGHRIGVCGTAVIKDGEIYNIKDINSLNIRLAYEVTGCADKLGSNIKNMLIISPPGCGKTTILRDICRRIGNTRKVSIADERGEIACVHNGISAFDIGKMTDVMSLCSKKTAMEIMIRSMSPEYIATDEIGEADCNFLKRIMSYGVNVLATAHGNNTESTLKRLGFEKGYCPFDKIVLLSNRLGIGTIEKITEVQND